MVGWLVSYDVLLYPFENGPPIANTGDGALSNVRFNRRELVDRFFRERSWLQLH
jgi:hypothetical protein